MKQLNPKRKKRSLAWLVCSALALLLLIWGSPLLSQTTAVAAEASSSQTVTGTSSGLTETEGILRVGMEVNYAPFNWSQTDDANGAVPVANSEGEYANGYDVQIAKKIADKLGLELEIVKTEWDGLPPAVMSGKIDAIIAGMSPTAERKEKMDFTDSYYTSDLVVVTLKSSPYAAATTLEALSGARITAQLNTFHYTVIDQIPGVVKETAMDTFPSMISAVLAGKIDGYVSEKPGAMAAVSSNPELVWTKFAEGAGFETSSEDTSIAVGLAKGSQLVEPINQILSQIPEEERQSLMQEMVDLNVGKETQSFWQEVGSLIQEYALMFLRGAGNTMLIAIVSTCLGFLLGLLVAVIRTIPIKRKKHKVGFVLHKLLCFLLSVYVEVFRGTPMMVQAMLIYYGSKLFFSIDMSSMSAAFLIVSINTGAYLAEVVRGGINSIDPGQTEAATALGMSHWGTMVRVVLPQAIKNILPAVGNEFVVNIKDTSVLNVISVTELYFISKSVAGSTYQIFQSYFITSVIYFVLTFTVTRILLLIERNMNGRTFVLQSTSVPQPVQVPKA
ncbi:MAG: ABC transporter permease subunit [Oscillospiraceae bacterium]|nr:ABC transporter permease subunit [Oscillospiraceae bacterium]MDD4368919.1 ABC transporter permease subunit [Oscillospiraceae bacterium]